MISDEFGEIEQLDENLRKWFKEKWVRFGPDGKIRGACARGDDSEGKPKCLPQKKAQNLGKKGRKYAASKKRREDPNPERRGKAKNVATKKNEDTQVNEKWSKKYKDSINCSNPKGFSQKAHCAGKKKNEDMNEDVPFNECPSCRGPIVHESMMNEKQDACYHKVKSRYKVWPSAYASGALVQCRKKGASNWGTGGKKKNESSIMKGIVDEARAKQYVKPYNDPQTGEQIGWVSSDGYHKKYWQKFAKDSAIKHAKLNPDEVQEDYTGEFAAEKTPAINPYGGLKDRQHRGAIGEDIEEAREMSPALRAAQQNLVDLSTGEVRRREDARKAAAKSQREYERQYNQKPKKPTSDQIWQKVEHAISNYFPDGDPTDYLNPYMERNGLNWDDITRAAKKNGYKDLWDYWNTLTQDIENDAYGDWLASDGKNVRTRGQFMEDDLDEACWKDYKQVGMKKKGGKEVPNCVPKESAIMKGLRL